MSETVSVSSFSRLLHPCSTFLVTCCGEDGRANIVTIAWLTPVSLKPPLLCMSLRPERFSYGLIKATNEFVVNVPSFELGRQSLYCGRISGAEVDKFAATGLTPAPAQHVRPPVIAECLAFLECRLVEDIEAGDHHIMLGEVLAAYAQQGILEQSGLYDLERAHPLLHVGGDRFTSTQVEAIDL
ncbi:MAG: flavin reductase family protein [Chloroflexota bacterium]